MHYNTNKSRQLGALRKFFFLLTNAVNLLERKSKKIYRCSSQPGAHFNTTAGSAFILFDLWFQTVNPKKFLQFFLA